MTINLLPPQIKHERKTMRLLSHFNRLIFLFIIISLCVWLGLFYFNRLFAIQLDALANENEEIVTRNKKYEPIEKQITDINEKLVKIDNVNKNRILWSRIIDEIAKCTPSQVQLSTLNLSQTSKSLTLNGRAETRREIARFKEKLESSDYFKNVAFPSSLFDTKENNYTFTLTAGLEQLQ